MPADITRSTNTGQDGAIIARSALEVSFAILRLLASKGLITKDDMAHILAVAYPPAASGPAADIKAFTDHVKLHLERVHDEIDKVQG
jgi:hypothetical protein